MQQVYVVHYHEIALKGRNRPMFLRTLQENICRATGLGKGRVKIVAGRLIVIPDRDRGSRPLLDSRLPAQVGGEGSRANARPTSVRDSSAAPQNEIELGLSRVFGISSFSPVVLVKAEYGEIEEALRGFVISGGRASGEPEDRPLRFETFAIRATRGDKKFPLTSKELEIKLGDLVREEFGKKVDLTDPDITFYIEVFRSGALIYTQRILGPGGLPVGTQPKVAIMLSGGIDSPVAAYRIMKRGAPIVGIHFHSYPFTTRASIDKVKELAGVLARYGGPMELYLVPLAEAQKIVVQNTAEPYRVLLYRRLMVRIAQELARKEGARALVTGESLGQVASQTVENMGVVEAVLHCAPPLTPPPQGGETKQFPPLPEGVENGPRERRPRGLEGVGAMYFMPIFRPLIGYDKEEIIAEAKRIGTYDVSILPHDDCCTIMMPKNPATRARLVDVEREEGKLEVEKLIKEAAARAQFEVVAAL